MEAPPSCRWMNMRMSRRPCCAHQCNGEKPLCQPFAGGLPLSLKSTKASTRASGRSPNAEARPRSSSSSLHLCTSAWRCSEISCCCCCGIPCCVGTASRSARKSCMTASSTEAAARLSAAISCCPSKSLRLCGNSVSEALPLTAAPSWAPSSRICAASAAAMAPAKRCCASCKRWPRLPVGACAPNDTGLATGSAQSDGLRSTSRPCERLRRSEGWERLARSSRWRLGLSERCDRSPLLSASISLSACSSFSFHVISSLSRSSSFFCIESSASRRYTSPSSLACSRSWCKRSTTSSRSATSLSKRASLPRSSASSAFACCSKCVLRSCSPSSCPWRALSCRSTCDLRPRSSSSSERACLRSLSTASCWPSAFLRLLRLMVRSSFSQCTKRRLRSASSRAKRSPSIASCSSARSCCMRCFSATRSWYLFSSSSYA
mmetsp:Transcript_98322/g.306779  ORF Transcript_98322/g.306779 Transcript_98322/m.306779 type:complete len:434 (+) Transcript_98322:830-2131(+)